MSLLVFLTHDLASVHHSGIAADSVWPEVFRGGIGQHSCDSGKFINSWERFLKKMSVEQT